MCIRVEGDGSSYKCNVFERGQSMAMRTAILLNVEQGRRRRFPFLLHVSEIIHLPLMVLITQSYNESKTNHHKDHLLWEDR